MKVNITGGYSNGVGWVDLLQRLDLDKLDSIKKNLYDFFIANYLILKQIQMNYHSNCNGNEFLVTYEEFDRIIPNLTLSKFLASLRKLNKLGLIKSRKDGTIWEITVNE